jgi:anti-sigma factor RsiW
MAAMHDKIPDWLLERLAAGELPQPQAAELRERLQAQGEEHRLSALAASSAEILATFPPERIVPEIERRAAAARRARPVAVRRLRPLWAIVHGHGLRCWPGRGPGSSRPQGPPRSHRLLKISQKSSASKVT